MKKDNGKLLALIMSVCLLSITVTALAVVRTPITEDTVPESVAADTYRYLLQSQDGELAVYTVIDNLPLKIATYEATLDDLPESDRAMLRQGIAIATPVELQAALEDYIA
ncbi:MAG: hypothetical protein LBR73_00695 [Oscillospiraceae bacterium]|jgi:hypothetical protein|nr:hypothetical protein [Oscillospiraceae bacterium]